MALPIFNDAYPNDVLSIAVAHWRIQADFPQKRLAQEYQLDYGGCSLGIVGAHENNCGTKSGARDLCDQAAERLGDAMRVVANPA
jgi:hypothetical protein